MFFGKILVLGAKTRIFPGFPVSDCRFLIDLSNFPDFLAQFGLMSDVLDSILPIPGFLLGNGIFPCFVAGGIDLSSEGCAKGGPL